MESLPANVLLSPPPPPFSEPWLGDQWQAGQPPLTPHPLGVWRGVPGASPALPMYVVMMGAATHRTMDAFGLQYGHVIFDPNQYTKKKRIIPMKAAMGSQKWMSLTSHPTARYGVRPQPYHTST